MDLNTFIITIYCLIDDWLSEQPPYRRRGPQPTMSDAEILTIEVVGIWLGIATDKGVYLYFQRHYGDYFPGLQEIHRTTFVRQSANLWAMKVALWRQLLRWIDHDPADQIIDSLPLPVCRFGRASYCRRLREVSHYGYDQVAKQRFLGLRVHVRLAWPGVIRALELVPAHIHDTVVAEEMLIGVTGQILGDRNYWKPLLRDRLTGQGLDLIAPFRLAHNTEHVLTAEQKHKRFRIETVFSQLVARFQGKQVWARDAWHLCSRWLRRIVAHCFGVLLCQQTGRPPLQFSKLVNV